MALRPPPSVPSALAALPVDAVMGEVVDALGVHSGAVLVAPPGSGKTTRVPPGLLDAGVVDGKVVVLQPRRVAARMVARRIAWERGSAVGAEVGWQVRFDKRTSSATRIEVVTEGLLTRRLLGDPFLEGTGLVVLDEFHERSLHGDLCLALLREVQRDARPDLRILVMSATLDPGPVAAFLGGPEAPAPVVRAGGRPFPVDVRPLASGDVDALERMAARAVRRALSSGPEGHVLVFLPGVREIERTAGQLKECGALVLPLHGRLPAAAQDRALAPSPQPKVVLATNIAETSVTLDGVVAVVDSGLVRRSVFDPARGQARLDTVPISRASADQRAGRAGRTRPGVCWRLWTAAEDLRRVPADVPEVRRSDLAEACLAVLDWGADPRDFTWFEAPPRALLDHAMGLLAQLRLVVDGRITDLGREVAQLPVHPRLAVALWAGHRSGCLDAVAAAAALASERDPWARGGAGGDLLDRVAWLGGAPGPDGDRRALSAARQVRDQLARLGRRSWGAVASGNTNDVDESTVAMALARGFPDRVGRRRGPGDPRFLLASGAGVRLGDSDVVGAAEWIVAVVVQGGGRGRDGVVRVASPLDPSSLTLSQDRRLVFDAAAGAVQATVRDRFGAITVAERRVEHPDPEAVTACLLAAALEAPTRALKVGPELLALLARLRFCRGLAPELELPDIAAPQDLLPALCVGRRAFAQLRRLDLCAEVLGGLSWPQRSALDRLAPERLLVPSGSRVRVIYDTPDDVPVLPVRIQQVFGWSQTPRVGGGQVPVTLHLLAPNNRPAQVTRDLASFWRSTYPAVRKELRGRYAKHAWPEDPLSAVAEDRPRRRR